MDKVIRRAVLYGVMLVVGIALAVLGETGILDSFWSGMGIGFAVVSVIRLVQLGRYRTNQAYAEKMDVSAGDERNRFLSEKARSFAFFWYTMLAAAAVVALRILGYAAYSSLAGMSVCVLMVLYWIGWLWMRRKY